MKKGFIGLVLAVILALAGGIAMSVQSTGGDPHPVCPPAGNPCP